MFFDRTKIKRTVLASARHNDLILAVLVVAVISLIILPLPTVLLDMLIAVNLGIAVSLLILAMYITDSTSLSTFPTLLLLSTLFRLSLNIATTRMILINTEAGKIIYTFGNFVVAGNFIVGAVIFLIITIVQFLVIAKGTERVAEVAARFTLDAMPGKQMSIDADLRSGSIDMSEALKRREKIQTESSLYGAIDGAMKFVKGDAIAGIIVTVINIIGGLSIGIFQKGIPLGKAIETYTVLTIGDGLISQIPALFISIAAGIIITRINGGAETHLGGEIGYQILSQPKGLLISGILLCCFALIPGFPKIQFLLIGSVMGVVGFVFFRNREQEMDAGGDFNVAKQLHPSFFPGFQCDAIETDQDFFLHTVPVQIDFNREMAGSMDLKALDKKITEVQKMLYMNFGVAFPGVRFHPDDTLAEGLYAIRIHEIPVANGKICLDRLFVYESMENLISMGIEAFKEMAILDQRPSIWVPVADQQKLEKAGIPFMGGTQFVAHHLMCVLKENMSEFIGLQETKTLLVKMEKTHPELIRELLKVMSISQITDVLRRLIEEEISIRNLNAIFHSLIEWGQKEKDVIMLTEQVRVGLKRYISNRYVADNHLLSAYLLHQNLEETIRNAIRQAAGGKYLLLGSDKSKQIIDAVKKEVDYSGAMTNSPVLLASMDIRRYVKKILEPEMKEIAILSYQELTPDISIQPLGMIEI